MEWIAEDRGLVMRPVSEADVDDLYEAVIENHEHLARWMPWAMAPRREHTKAFVAGSIAQADRGDGLNCVIARDGRIVGVAGFHDVSRRNRSASLGYWLAAAAVGGGVMTWAVTRLLGHAFDGWDLHRVEIRAAPDNLRSRAIPRRLGFSEEGVLRGAERFGDEYRDQVVYSLLRPEWDSRAG